MRVGISIHDEFSWVMPLPIAALPTFLPTYGSFLRPDLYQTSKKHSTTGRLSGRSPWIAFNLGRLKVTFSATYWTSCLKSTLKDRARKSLLPLLALLVNAPLACAYIRGDDTDEVLEPQKRFNAIIDHSEPDHVPLLDTMYTLTLEPYFLRTAALAGS